MKDENQVMKFTPEQKLILKLLCDIHQKLNIDDGMNSNVIAYAIETNNTWAITDHHHFDFEEPVSREKVTFVCDILDMYENINYSFKQLSAQEKESIKNLCGVKDDDKNPIPFPGFDGNNEGIYRSIISMLFKMERYIELNGKPLNSHRRMVPTYQKMLNIYEEVNDHSSGSPLSVKALNKILDCF